ncbi:hypothetical protein EVAR_32699_1 [Eumeta japonica]|uniref:Uncharacterized protein n=1 Tax=Eumeta variegata TaxID=151549 RepID=A0A4C1VNG0_EUMVA|nr:hypothetical protein EVAR_32699_1 [Eumeta japonica]
MISLTDAGPALPSTVHPVHSYPPASSGYINIQQYLSFSYDSNMPALRFAYENILSSFISADHAVNFEPNHSVVIDVASGFSVRSGSGLAWSSYNIGLTR